jgi:hypothetical protein
MIIMEGVDVQKKLKTTWWGRTQSGLEQLACDPVDELPLRSDAYADRGGQPYVYQ